MTVRLFVARMHRRVREEVAPLSRVAAHRPIVSIIMYRPLSCAYFVSPGHCSRVRRANRPRRPTRCGEMAQTGLMERDRDDAGRPRNARPRDGLGRPLPYGAQGVPRQPEDQVRTPEQTLNEAQQLFDSGRPFHAHEVFEDAWKAARKSDDAGLWKGLAQLAVGCTHRLRGNTEGADRLLRRAAAALAPYASTRPYDIDVAQLQAWAQQPQDRSMPRLRGSPERPTQ